MIAKEMNKMVAVQVTVPPELADYLRGEAGRRCLSVSAVAREILMSRTAENQNRMMPAGVLLKR